MVNGTRVQAIDHIFTLTNDLQVTYGQVNGQAGDFYGTCDAISDGKDEKAFGTLNDKDPRMPMEAEQIMELLWRKVVSVEDALEWGEDPSFVYHLLPDLTDQL